MTHAQTVETLERLSYGRGEQNVRSTISSLAVRVLL
jgi:hypothetical protein